MYMLNFNLGTFTPTRRLNIQESYIQYICQTT